MGRAGAAQNVPEKDIVVQNFRGDIFHGNADNLAVLRRADLLLRLHHVKLVAVGAGDGLEGLHVDGGIHGLYTDFVVNFLQIHGIRFAFGLCALRLHGKDVHAIGVQNLIEQVIYVEIHAGSPHRDDQRQLGGAVFVKFVRRKLGNVAFQGVGGLGQQTAGGSGVVLQNALDIILLQMQVGQQPDDVVAPEGRLVGLLTLGLGAGSAVFIGGVYGGLDIQLCAGVTGGQPQCGIAQRHHHVLLRVGLAGDGTDGSDGVGFTHPAHIHTGNGDVVQNFLAVGVTGDVDDENGDEGENQNQRGGAQGHHHGLLVAVYKGENFIQEGRSAALRGFLLFVQGEVRFLVGNRGVPFGKQAVRFGNQAVCLGDKTGGLRVGSIQIGNGGLGENGILRLRGLLLAGQLAEAFFNFTFFFPVWPGVGKFSFRHRLLLS